jgi:hypothetical protein
MAYLFMVVGISAINALLQINQCIPWFIFANSFLVVLTFVVEKVYFSRVLSCRTITFSNTDLLKPSRHDLLLKQLKELTELDIIRFEIGKVDYIKGQGQIRIFYAGDANGIYNRVDCPDEDE